MTLHTLVQETAAAIDHEYQAGVCLGGSPYIRALEVEMALFDFAERAQSLAYIDLMERMIPRSPLLRLVSNG